MLRKLECYCLLSNKHKCAGRTIKARITEKTNSLQENCTRMHIGLHFLKTNIHEWRVTL